jgi:hypothetical protein
LPPFTCNFTAGLVVPMPTLPAPLLDSRMLPGINPVPEFMVTLDPLSPSEALAPMMLVLPNSPLIIRTVDPPSVKVPDADSTSRSLLEGEERILFPELEKGPSKKYCSAFAAKNGFSSAR